MAEEVNTGGTRRFVYPKGYKPEIDEEEDRRLQQPVYGAYEKARKRKLRNKILWWSAGILAVIIILSMILLA